MQFVFKTIGVLGKQHAPEIAPAVRAVVDFLREHDRQFVLNESAAEALKDPQIPVSDLTGIGEQCDLAVVIGGDGTILNAARGLCDFGLPLVCVNQGRLGFLADISPDQLPLRLHEILVQGHYLMEERFLLHASVVRDGEAIAESNALNDVILHKWNMARMIEVDVYVNNQFLSSQRSDGLIVATPTGSTAYALSGGGPVLHPTLDAMVLVPICPHTLSNRPIVVNGESRITLVLNDCYYDHAQLACDGQINISLQEHDHIQIRKKENPIRLIHPAHHDHFQILRTKLKWG
jgi:NAD+ kinase